VIELGVAVGNGMAMGNTRAVNERLEEPMRINYLAIVLLASVAYGCGGGSRGLVTAPSAIAPPPPIVPTEPRMSPPFNYPRQTELGTAIALGTTTSSGVTADDPICPDSGAVPYRCQYFRLAVPETGVLDVTIRWSTAQRDPYPLDMGVIGPSGAGWVSEFSNGPYRIARGQVSGGNTYVIEVWSFLTPPEPFELTTSIR
jgi:hypothetical protein